MQSSGEQGASKLVWSYKGHSYSLPFAASDILQLARAIEQEGAPQEGVAWALLQRAAWLTSQGQRVNLGALVSAYAQPINPAWFPGGAKHEAEVTRLQNNGDFEGAKAEIARAAKRPVNASLEWAEISPGVKVLVESILSGASTSPVPGAVHYWATRGPDFATNQAKKPDMLLLDRGYGFKKTNVFFGFKGHEDFGRDLRVVGGKNAWPGEAPLLVANVMSPQTLLAGAVVGVLFWKWMKRHGTNHGRR